MKTIYHLVFADETVTFLTEEDKAAFIEKVAPANTEFVACSSQIEDSEYRELEAMSQEEGSVRNLRQAQDVLRGQTPSRD